MAAPTVPVIAPQDDIRGWQFTVNLDSAYRDSAATQEEFQIPDSRFQIPDSGNIIIWNLEYEIRNL
jgi:hypothetical protein